MEEKKLIPKDQLKTYFENGKRPTENQFSDLIDALKHKGDALTNREAVMIANSLESIASGYIVYSGSGINDKKFLIAISSDEKEDQIVTLINSPDGQKKLYFLGNAPYTIKAKDFPTDGLEEYEYYYASCQLAQNSSTTRLFGGDLPKIDDGFEFGKLEDKNLIFQVGKLNVRQKVELINTNIKFVNTTGVPVQYNVQAVYWSHGYTGKDIIASNYNIWNFLSLYFRADLRQIDQSIECNIYNEENGNLLMTTYLNARQNNQNIPANETIRETKSIRIECRFAVK